MTERPADEIRYEAAPGYRRIFHRVMAAAAIYLAFIFVRTLL